MSAPAIILIIIIGLALSVLLILGFWSEEEKKGRGTQADATMQRIKTALEITVLLGGALIAGVLFLFQDRPALGRYVEFTSELESEYQPGTGACLTEFVVTVRNPSRTTLRVDSTHTYLVKLPQPPATDAIQHDTGFTVRPRAQPRTWPDSTGLAYSYPPDAAYTDAFVWRHRPLTDSLLLARIELFAHGRMLDFHYQWDPGCTAPADSAPPPAAP